MGKKTFLLDTSFFIQEEYSQTDINKKRFIISSKEELLIPNLKHIEILNTTTILAGKVEGIAKDFSNTTRGFYDWMGINFKTTHRNKYMKGSI